MPMSARARGAVVLGLGLLLGCPTPKPVVPALPEDDGSSSSGGGDGSTGSGSGGPSTSAGTSAGSTSSGDEGSSSGEPVACELGVGQGCLAPRGEWWPQGGSWAFRRRIELSSPLATPLDDAVVPIVLDDGFEYGCANADASDLRFVDDGGTVLDHEIDEWHPGQGAVAWVRLPTLPPAGTTLWLYYGNASTVGLSAEVWPATVGYQAVLHFGDDLQDARGVHHGMPAVPGESLFAQGAIGRAVHFEEVLVDRRVELTATELIDDAIVSSQSLTVSAWIHATPNVAARRAYRAVASRGTEAWRMSLHDAGTVPWNFSPPVHGLFVTYCDEPVCTGYFDMVFHTHASEGTAAVVEHEVLAFWHHLAVVLVPLGGGDFAKRLYVDGVLDAEDVGPRPLEWATLSLHEYPITIGTGPQDSDQYVFHGEIDELHVASEAFGADRLRVEAAFGDPDGPSLVQLDAPECQ